MVSYVTITEDIAQEKQAISIIITFLEKDSALIINNMPFGH